MVKKSILVLLLVALCSCANLSKNQVITETFDLRGGKFGNQTWDDHLALKRTSWYTELTLVYDLLVTKMEPTSPFWQWLSNSEKQAIANCADHYVVIAYSQDSKKISHSMFRDAAIIAGYRTFALGQFENYLQLHPDFAKNSFHLYKVFGLCQEPGHSSNENIVLQFPNFKEIVLK